MHCKKGTIFTVCYKRGTKLTLGVHRPLCSKRGMPIVPPIPCVQDCNRQLFSAMLSRECGAVTCPTCMCWVPRSRGSSLCVYTCCKLVLAHASYIGHRLAPSYNLETKVVLVDKKICMLAGYSGYIIVLDWTASSLSTIQHPQGVTCKYFKTMLSPANDASSVYDIHVKKFELRIWLYG